MIRLLVIAILAASGPALAQTTGSVKPVAVLPSDKDDVPPGGCTPIGVTVSGEIVFPFTCKAFLEQRRGPIEEPKPAAQVEKPVQAEKPAQAEKSVAAAPAQAAVPAKTEPVVQPVEADSSSASSIEGPKQVDDGKRSRQAKRHRRTEPNGLVATKKP
jgi:hypothetical protein